MSDPEPFDGLIAERNALAADFRRRADTLEHGTEADAVEMPAGVYDQIVALVPRAAPFTRGH